MKDFLTYDTQQLKNELGYGQDKPLNFIVHETAPQGQVSLKSFSQMEPLKEYLVDRMQVSKTKNAKNEFLVFAMDSAIEVKEKHINSNALLLAGSRKVDEMVHALTEGAQSMPIGQMSKGKGEGMELTFSPRDFKPFLFSTDTSDVVFALKDPKQEGAYTLYFNDYIKSAPGADYIFKIDKDATWDAVKGEKESISLGTKNKGMAVDASNIILVAKNGGTEQVVGKGFSSEAFEALSEEKSKNLFRQIFHNENFLIKSNIRGTSPELFDSLHSAYREQRLKGITAIDFATFIGNKGAVDILQQIDQEKGQTLSAGVAKIFDDVLSRLPESSVASYHKNTAQFNVFFAIADNDLSRVKETAENDPTVINKNAPKELLDLITPRLQYTPLEFAAMLDRPEIFETLLNKIGPSASMPRLAYDGKIEIVPSSLKASEKERFHDPVLFAIENGSSGVLKIVAEKYPQLLNERHVGAVSEKLIGEGDKTAYNILNKVFIEKGLVDTQKPSRQVHI